MIVISSLTDKQLSRFRQQTTDWIAMNPSNTFGYMEKRRMLIRLEKIDAELEKRKTSAS